MTGKQGVCVLAQVFVTLLMVQLVFLVIELQKSRKLRELVSYNKEKQHLTGLSLVVKCNIILSAVKSE